MPVISDHVVVIIRLSTLQSIWQCWRMMCNNGPIVNVNNRKFQLTTGPCNSTVSTKNEIFRVLHNFDNDQSRYFVITVTVKCWSCPTVPGGSPTCCPISRLRQPFSQYLCKIRWLIWQYLGIENMNYMKCLTKEYLEYVN